MLLFENKEQQIGKEEELDEEEHREVGNNGQQEIRKRKRRKAQGRGGILRRSRVGRQQKDIRGKKMVEGGREEVVQWKERIGLE